MTWFVDANNNIATTGWTYLMGVVVPTPVLHVGGIDALVGQYQMRGQRDQGASHGPDVQVMHVADTARRQQHLAHGRQLDVLGHAVEQQVQRLAEQAPGAGHDDGRDDEARHRVEPVPAEPQREAAGHHHAG